MSSLTGEIPILIRIKAQTISFWSLQRPFEVVFALSDVPVHDRRRLARGVPYILRMDRGPETDTQPRAGAVITVSKARRRPSVPIPIKCEIPVQLSPKLHIVRRVHIELKSSGIRNRGQHIRGEVQRCFVEPEHLELRTHQSRGYLLGLSR